MSIKGVSSIVIIGLWSLLQYPIPSNAFNASNSSSANYTRLCHHQLLQAIGDQCAAYYAAADPSQYINNRNRIRRSETRILSTELNSRYLLRRRLPRNIVERCCRTGTGCTPSFLQRYCSVLRNTTRTISIRDQTSITENQLNINDLLPESFTTTSSSGRTGRLRGIGQLQIVTENPTPEPVPVNVDYTF